MDRLEAYKQEIALEHGVPFITAIFDVGDLLSDQSGGFFGMSPMMHADRIVYWFLKQESDLKRRGDVIVQAATATTGVSLPIVFTQIQGQRAENHPEDDLFISNDARNQLQQVCIANIRLKLKAEEIPNNLASVLYNWREWSGPDEPKQYCESIVKTPLGLLAFLRAFTVKSTSQGIGDFVARPRWYIRSKDIELFVSFELIESEFSKLASDINLIDEDRRAVSAFKEAAERRRAGKPDNSPFARD